MTHCQRGDEVILGQDAHTYRYEGGGAAVLGSIQPQPIENAADGSLPLAKIAGSIKADDAHFARTRLLALENTIGGKVLPLGYCREATSLAHKRGLATHLDGARFFNAAIALRTDVKAVAAGFDSASICLSKGLGAPVGSVLLGSRAFIDAARRPRKMLGGAMRQAGIIAAAGLYALQNNVLRLAEDHDNARRLAAGLRELEEIEVDGPHTNMVFATVAPDRCEPLANFLRAARHRCPGHAAHAAGHAPRRRHRRDRAHDRRVQGLLRAPLTGVARRGQARAGQPTLSLDV